MAALRNTELAGRYRLTARIATGGMGEVWRGEDTLLHRRVAVKVLKSALTSDQTFVERFRAEARNTAALTHPGIAAVHDYGEITDGDERTAYLVMELVEGEPLSAILVRTGRLPVARVLDIVGQAAAALEAAHRTGMVHRDVKPGNLLVGPDNTVKVTDFGIARVADTVPLTQAGMVVGTAQYFAPEQAEGKRTTPASDVYSLGVVAYECLAGRLPFVADSSVAVAVMQIRDQAPPLPEDVPPPVRGLVDRAMAKDPRRRFATGGEFAAAVRAVRTGHPVHERTAMVAGPPRGSTRILPHPPRPRHPAGPPMYGQGTGPIPRPVLGSVLGPVPGPPLAPSAPVPVPVTSHPVGLPGSHPSPPPRSAPEPGQHTGVSLGQHGTGTVAGPVPSVPPTRRTVVLASLVGLGVLVLVLGVVFATRHPSHPNGRITNNPSIATDSNPAGGGAGGDASPRTVTVTASDYVGRPVEDVSRELRLLGLVPTVRYADQGGPPGSVVTVAPDGHVPAGARVEIVAVDRRPGGRSKN
ncbi:MAG TPA: protein kinase [Mycobacteriales bacterium]|nr:protein kinase [Mycobacteriales bacterium]